MHRIATRPSANRTLVLYSTGRRMGRGSLRRASDAARAIRRRFAHADIAAPQAPRPCRAPWSGSHHRVGLRAFPAASNPLAPRTPQSPSHARTPRPCAVRHRRRPPALRRPTYLDQVLRSGGAHNGSHTACLARALTWSPTCADLQLRRALRLPHDVQLRLQRERPHDSNRDRCML